MGLTKLLQFCLLGNSVFLSHNLAKFYLLLVELRNAKASEREKNRKLMFYILLIAKFVVDG